MKFYRFDENEFEYMAIIWAQSEEKAVETYKNSVCSVGNWLYVEPEEIDIDKVFQLMVDSGFDGDEEIMEIGHIGRLYKIIKSISPVVVLHNCE